MSVENGLRLGPEQVVSREIGGGRWVPTLNPDQAGVSGSYILTRRQGRFDYTTTYLVAGGVVSITSRVSGFDGKPFTSELRQVPLVVGFNAQVVRTDSTPAGKLQQPKYTLKFERNH